jgi:NADH-quinone oxidoreductase subunit M
MGYIFNNLLTITTFLPLAGALLLLLIPRNKTVILKNTAFIITVFTFLLSLLLFFNYDASNPQMQFVVSYKWLEGIGASYFIGIDGISLFMIILTTFLTPVAVLSSYNYIKEKEKEYYISLLLLETGMTGVFVALDMLLFYLFWEAMLIPMYIIIGVWGGPRRIYAAVKFFIYTMIGSVLMLVAILVIYFLHEKQTGAYSFSLFDFYKTTIPPEYQLLMFFAFALAFAIKVPMFPFHTWLPDAHVEAPTAGSVILAGVLLKMGVYGFIRFAVPIFPEVASELAPYIALAGVVGIIYGSLVAWSQNDVKKLVAYSSVAHLGAVMLGLFSNNVAGVEGAVLQMVNHGLSTGALFLLVGMLYERRHTRMIEDYGGIAKIVPVFSTFFMLVMLSSIGLPGLNGFVGEFLIIFGAFQRFPVLAALGVLGVILSAVYMLSMYQRVVFGGITKEENKKMKDVNIREWLYMLPVLAMIVFIGVFPAPFLKKMETSVKQYIAYSQKWSPQVQPAIEIENKSGEESQSE